MKKNFKNDSKTCVYVLCHGSWAKQLVKDTTDHFGLTADYHVYPLMDEMSLSDYQETIYRDVKLIFQEDNLLFLTDLMDGATSITALKLASQLRGAPVIPGLSLELLLAVDEYLETKDGQLFETLLEVTSKTNINLCDKINFFR